jgi:hypothetical protein
MAYKIGTNNPKDKALRSFEKLRANPMTQPYIARGRQYYEVYLREGILQHNAKCKRSQVWAI